MLDWLYGRVETVENLHTIPHNIVYGFIFRSVSSMAMVNPGTTIRQHVCKQHDFMPSRRIKVIWVWQMRSDHGA